MFDSSKKIVIACNKRLIRQVVTHEVGGFVFWNSNTFAMKSGKSLQKQISMLRATLAEFRNRIYEMLTSYSVYV